MHLLLSNLKYFILTGVSGEDAEDAPFAAYVLSKHAGNRRFLLLLSGELLHSAEFFIVGIK